MKRSLQETNLLAITWLKDKSLADLDNLSNTDELAEEIVENLEECVGCV